MNSVFNMAFGSACYVGLVSNPSGLPPGAIAYADFKNGTYYYGGNALSDLFVENTDWATFDPTGKIVPGVGYVGGTDADGPTIATALAANFLSTGYTLVANVSAIADGASFGSDFLELPDFDPDVSFVVGSDGTASVIANSSGPHTFPLKIASTLTPTRVACSINGDDATEDTFSHTGFTNVVMSFNGSTVEDVAFYPPKTNVELKTLSTLP